MPAPASCSARTAPADRRPTSIWTSLFRGGPSGAPALLFNSTVGNAAAGLAGLEYKLCGPNVTISQKEASGLAAIATAVDLLRLGRADALGAGGMDAIYDIFYRAHDRFDVMSDAAAFDDSLRAVQPIATGLRDGRRRLRAVARARDGRSRPSARSSAPPRRARTCALNAWPPDPEPLVRTMSLALEDAGCAASDVDVVYASANATLVLDEVEARALVDALRRFAHRSSRRSRARSANVARRAPRPAWPRCCAAPPGECRPSPACATRIRSRALCGWR